MNTPFEKLKKKELLVRGKRHIFSTGLMDSANDLCNQNMKYGLAKLQYTQYQLGMEPNATFIAAPDATVSRNVRRWQNGFGYGGKISWGEGNEKFIALDTMPNACGMLVGGLNEIPEMDELVSRIDEINTQEDSIDGIAVKWDFAVGNHFIDLFELKPLTVDIDFPYKYAFIIHGSVPELKGDNETEDGLGMYYHHSKNLQQMTEVIETPFGGNKVLTGDNATRYLDFCNYANIFSKKRRLRAAERLFDDFEEITNPIHQGLLNMNEIILGSQNTRDRSTGGIFPLALRADLPAYLLKGNTSFDEDTIEILGFSKRAEKYNVMHRLKNANILPHGGGYSFPHILGIKRIIETVSGIRYFVTEMSSGVDSEMVFATPRELQFTYRGRQVLSRTLELGLGISVAMLVPIIIIKA